MCDGAHRLKLRTSLSLRSRMARAVGAMTLPWSLQLPTVGRAVLAARLRRHDLLNMAVRLAVIALERSRWSALTKQVLHRVVSSDHRRCNDRFNSRWRVQRFDDSPLRASLWSGRRSAAGGTRCAAGVESCLSTHSTARTGSWHRSPLRWRAGRGAVGRVRRTAGGSAGHQTDAPRTLPTTLLDHLSLCQSYPTDTSTIVALTRSRGPHRRLSETVFREWHRLASVSACRGVRGFGSQTGCLSWAANFLPAPGHSEPVGVA